MVTDIVSKREIRVDQANWQNHGEIDHATPVLDVSAKNDWSQVRVWDIVRPVWPGLCGLRLYRQDRSARRTTTSRVKSSPCPCGACGSAPAPKPGLAATGAAFLSALGFFFSRLFFCSRLAMGLSG